MTQQHRPQVRLPYNEWNVATCANPTESKWCSSLSWLQGDGRLLYAGVDGPISSIRLAGELWLAAAIPVESPYCSCKR